MSPFGWRRSFGSSVPAITKVLLAFLSILGTTTYTAHGAACDSGDSAALLEFKRAFRDPGGIFSTWTPGSDCCSWLGVNCSDTGRVQGLKVQAPAPRYGLQPSRDPNYNGVVGGSLGSLSQLTYLTLTNVYFNAPAPSSLGQLSHLAWLTLISDNFQGPIPPSFGQLTSLVTVSITSGFSGNIPNTLCSWVKIKDLDLSANFFTGGIPNCIYKWTSVSTIRFTANQLSGTITPVFGALGTLTLLDLTNNRFVGAIPKTLWRLYNLQYLLLSENQLSGSIPAWLGNLKSLFSVDLSQNALSGKIPPQLGSLPELTYLALYDNKLVGQIPPQLALLPKIGTLQLGSNRLTGCFPKEFGSVAAANGLSIDVSNNYLTCPLPPNLGNLASLFGSNNYFTGDFPIALTAASQVVLSSNRLTGFAASAADLPAEVEIFDLDLNNNGISGPLPAWFSLLSTLRVLDVSRNKITGGLPVSFLQLPVITEVNISRNLLNAELPSQPFTTVIGSLDASHNKLFGAISEAFVNALTSTFYVDLSFNKLSGTVPADIVKPGLQYLNLANNDFTGPVPSVP